MIPQNHSSNELFGVDAMKQVELFGQHILNDKPKRTPIGYDPLKGITIETKQDIFASFGPKKNDVPKDKSFEQID